MTDAPELSDPLDYHTLMRKILTAAVLDYMHLQHPAKRRKADIRRALGSASDMLFDDDYRAMKLHNDDGTPMSLKDIVEGAHPFNVVDIEKMRQEIIKQAEELWSEPDLRTLDIPEFLTIRGYVYSVIHKDDASEIDFQSRMIFQDTTKGAESEHEFVKLAMHIAAYHTDTKISGVQLDKLGDAWFELLRMNQCFTGV